MPHVANKTEFRVTRFHLYGHEYGCSVTWNPIRSMGWGQTIGEEMEVYWSTASHLVASGRVMSSAWKTQRLHDNVLFRARIARHWIGYLFRQRYNRTKDIIRQNKAILDSLLGTVLPNNILITSEYLDQQKGLQEEYFRTYRKPKRVELLEIFVAIDEEEQFARNLALNWWEKFTRTQLDIYHDSHLI